MPLDSFDLSDAIQRARAFHFSNLRPMWGLENCSKNARVPPGFFWNRDLERYLWGPVEDRWPEDAHHTNLDLDPTLAESDIQNEVDHDLNNYAEEGDDEDEEEEDDDDD